MFGLSLGDIWFVLITILFTGFFVLEGYDYGVGVLARFLGKTDEERRIYLNTIGPFWDANEVWLLTAGGAMFAAFPAWYASMFSAFYLALVLMLVALILRGVSFEFRGKIDHPVWANVWDWAATIGSGLAAILWGVAVANLMAGIQLGENQLMQGTFFSLLTPFTILGGVMMLLIMLTHGAQFIVLRTTGELRQRAQNLTYKLVPITIVVMLVFALWALVQTDIFTNHGVFWFALPVFAVLTMGASLFFNKKDKDGWAFAMTALTLVFLVISVFAGMFPRVLISSLDPKFTMTIADAASGDYTLTLMTIISLTLLPFVLAYTVWSYYVFRHRISTPEQLEY